MLSSVTTLSGFGYVFNTKGTVGCFIAAWFGNVFGLGTVFWNIVISSNTYLMVVHPILYKRLSRDRTLLYFYVSIGWGIPLLISAAAFASGKMGPTPGETCWIDDEWYLALEVPFWVGLIWAIISLIAADRVSVQYALGTTASRAKSLVEVMAFSVTFYMAWLFPVLWDILVHVTGSYEFRARNIISYAVVVSSTGLLNAVVWSFLAFRGRRRRTSKPAFRSHLVEEAAAVVPGGSGAESSLLSTVEHNSSLQYCIPIPTESGHFQSSSTLAFSTYEENALPAYEYLDS
jgi:hypothetical protein